VALGKLPNLSVPPLPDLRDGKLNLRYEGYRTENRSFPIGLL
jgi:hypothetical protein